MLMIEERRAAMYRMTLDAAARIGKPKKQESITSPDVAVNAMRQAILTHNDVRHAVYRADIGYVDFVWGSEGEAPSVAGRRKGAKGIAHILEARIRKDGLSQKQAERLAEEIARVVATGKLKQSRVVAGTSNVQITDGKHTAVLVKEPGTDAWLLSGWENK